VISHGGDLASFFKHTTILTKISGGLRQLQLETVQALEETQFPKKQSLLT